MNCKHCGALLRFVTMESGRRMPCDPIAVPAGTPGNLVAAHCRTREIRPGQSITMHVHGHVVTAAREADEGAELFVPHWATCPSLKKARR